MTEKSPTPNDDIHPSQTKKDGNNKALYIVIVFLMLIFGITLGIVLEKQGGISQLINQLTGKDTDTEESTQPESPVLSVEIIHPKLAKISTNISADGTVTAKNTASVSSKINGLAIEKVLVEEGKWVNKGDVLATFDTKKLQQNSIQAEAGIMQAEGNVMQAEVNLAKVKSDLNRVLPLLKIGAVSQQDVDTYHAQVKQSQAGLFSAKASVVSAKAQFTNQKINYQDSKLLAPVSGIISQKTAQIGAIPEGSLFTIIENGLLEWQAELNPEDVSKLKVGMPVAIKGIDNDTNNVISNQLIQGKVSRIDPVANTNRQISVYVALALKQSVEQGIQSGMLLTGQFIIGADTQIILPVSAITSSDGYDYLMAVREIKVGKDEKGKPKITGRIERIKVELGRQENNAVIIKTQLPSNTSVVSQGGSFLSEGDLVRVVQK